MGVACLMIPDITPNIRHYSAVLVFLIFLLIGIWFFLLFQNAISRIHYVLMSIFFILAFLLEFLLLNLLIFPIIFGVNQLGAYENDMFYYAHCVDDSPISLGASRYEDVVIKTDDGYGLKGWFVAPHLETKATIIMVSGNKNNRCGMMPYAGMLVEAGYGVLLYDVRGFSLDDNEERNKSKEGNDLASIIDYLRSRAEVNPKKIGLVGGSSGALAALQAIELRPGTINTAWLDGLTAINAEDYPDMNSMYSRLVVMSSIMTNRFQYFFQAKAGLPNSLQSTSASFLNTKIMVVATGQTYMEVDTAKKFVATQKGNAQIWILDELSHCTGIFLKYDEYKPKMLDFFNANLK